MGWTFNDVEYEERWQALAAEEEYLLRQQALYDLYEGQAMRRPVQVAYNRSLPYQEFLKSLYWQYVRQLIFRQWGRRGCAKCGNRRVTLDVHHKTYEHQGDELNHMEDLTVLCQACHTAIHKRL